MPISNHDKSLKIHIFPVGPHYYGADNPMSEWVNMVIADHWHTDNGVRAYVHEGNGMVSSHHREDIFALIPSMARRFKDVVIHLDPLV